MTSAGLLSLLFAGTDKNDPRVQAAYKWMTANYTLDVNPGTTKKHGLFYFYNAYAKVMAAYGEDTFTDGKGQKHNWRNELVQKLLSLQAADGSCQSRFERVVGRPAATRHCVGSDRPRTRAEVILADNVSHRRLSMPRKQWISSRSLVAVVGLIALSTAAMAQQRVLRVISDRTDQGTLRPILDAFEAKSGAKIVGMFMDQGLVNRLESRPPRPKW